MNSQGYGKPKRATWFFPAPWQGLLLPPLNGSFKHLQVDFIQCSHLVWVINMFLLLYLCFLEGWKLSPAGRLLYSW